MNKKVLGSLCLFSFFILSACNSSVKQATTEISTSKSQSMSPIELSQEPEEEAREITITVGNTIIEARLNESEAAQEFARQLPQTISMRRMGEHEYYGSLDESLTHAENTQVGYEIGDIAFWTPGNLFALYFDTPQSDPEGLMILGEITSDIEEVRALSNNEEMFIERKE